MIARTPIGFRQQGAVLAVALILLMLITLLVTSAYRMSSSNLSAVGNLQFRTQVIAAADTAIERTISAGVAGPETVSQSLSISDPNSESAEFTVQVTRTCVSHVPSPLIPGTGIGSSVLLGPGFTPEGWEYIALFDYEATVSDAVTGAEVVVRKGIRQRITPLECTNACSPCE